MIPTLDTEYDTGSDLILLTVAQFTAARAVPTVHQCRTFRLADLSPSLQLLNVKENLITPFLTITQTLTTKCYHHPIFCMSNTLATELLLLNFTGLYSTHCTMFSIIMHYTESATNLHMLQLLWYAGLSIISACDGRLASQCVK